MNSPSRSPHSPQPPRPQSRDSTSSGSSASSQATVGKPVYSQYQAQQGPRQILASAIHPNSSTTSLQNFSRPNPNAEVPRRNQSPRGPPSHRQHQHHTQGFFEPTLPTATSSGLANMPNPNLTASQIAAQAAMQHQQVQHSRQRSQTVPNPHSPPEIAGGRRNPNSPPAQPGPTDARGVYHNGLLGSYAAATSAANAAFPRSTIPSPALPSADAPSFSDREHKQKPEKSKMKLFSKPRSVGISKDKDIDKKDRPFPSPKKILSASPLPRVNPSSVSLADSLASSPPSSLYFHTNSSTSTLQPSTEKTGTTEKHKHYFLSRQKHKAKEKEEHHHLPLSSASSNSKPRDPLAPQSLYSFAPSSPGPSATSFAKSMSGLDLRHGRRALREKKKEEKEKAANPGAIMGTEGEFPVPGEWPGPSSLGSTAGASFLGAPAPSSASTYSSAPSVYGGDLGGGTGLQGFGLHGMTPDDAWPFLKAKLLVIFEDEDLRLPVEDFNRLVNAHIQRCVQQRAPTILLEDLRELLQTGFSSLDQTLRLSPDDRLVTKLVDMWLFVFGNILPYMQAVFLPLDLEFKGSGNIMTAQEAREFWGALLGSESDSTMGEELDVRRIVLIAYRDAVILSRHNTLEMIFSRLSLESINAFPDILGASPDGASSGRPDTSASSDPPSSSFNSQTPTLLNEPVTLSGNRSRATSNTSSGYAMSGETYIGAAHRSPAPAVVAASPPDSAVVTETVGRMLQCVSVLASVQTGDDAQMKMERLSKTLKHNWLGRGRTGRNRRGFVGTRLAGSRPAPPSSPLQQVQVESML
ncbi:MAG: hypothetical protein M1839_001054 [Geoglossum umbratile]|nr:MAG: hypothetical protein M1839_001054 [Geoglossum umbratile]